MFFSTDARMEEALKSDYQRLDKQHEIYEKNFPARGSFGLRLNHSGKKSFFVIYNLAGKRKRVTLGSPASINIEEARAKALEIISRAELGYDPAKEQNGIRTALTVSDLYPKFLSDLKKKGRKTKTREEYSRLLEKEVLPIWGDRKLKNISTADILELSEHVGEIRNSPVMADRLSSVLSSFFAFAKRKALIEANPVKHDKIEKSEKREFFRELELEEFKAIWKALEAEEPATSLAFKLLIYSGQKPSEVLNMRWKDLNLDLWQVSDGQTTGKRKHEVFLSNQVIKLIKQVKMLRLSDEFVLPSSKKKDKPLGNIRKAAARISARAGLDDPFAPLDLRRCFPRQLLQLKVRPDVIEKILNRCPGKTHLRGYYKDFEYQEDIQVALNKWSKVLFDFDKPAKPAPTSANVIPLFS